MILSQIATGVTSLHDQLLAGDGSARERELVTGTAPGRLGLAREAHGGPPVAQGLVDGPGALVRAHVGGAAGVAAGPGGAVVVERRVRLGACPDKPPAVRLLRPAARRLATVPVARRLPGARGPLRRGQPGEGESR